MKRLTWGGMSIRWPVSPCWRTGEFLKNEANVSSGVGDGTKESGMLAVGNAWEASSLMIACTEGSVLVNVREIARKMASPKTSTVSARTVGLVLTRKKEWAMQVVKLNLLLTRGRPTRMAI